MMSDVQDTVTPWHPPADTRHTCKENTMADALQIDKSTTALLSMDFENGILGMFKDTQHSELVNRSAATLAAARKAGVNVTHVVVRFRPGHPEVSPRNMRFSDVKKANGLVEGSPAAEIHAPLAPQGDEILVTKVRVGAFSTTNLEVLMRAKGITTLVLQGIITSGVVLSTVRWAADMDYRLIVLSDCCADPDPEVHRVLIEKVFPRQAVIATSEEFIKALG